MTVGELIKALLDQPLDAQAYVGKGMGPAETVEPDWSTCTSSGDLPLIIISPGTAE